MISRRHKVLNDGFIVSDSIIQCVPHIRENVSAVFVECGHFLTGLDHMLLFSVSRKIGLP
jgi:hypothetical protein